MQSESFYKHQEKIRADKIKNVHNKIRSDARKVDIQVETRHKTVASNRQEDCCRAVYTVCPTGHGNAWVILLVVEIKSRLKAESSAEFNA